MNKDIEIMGFNNFEQFLAYIRQNGSEMKNWSSEKTKEFCDKVMKLREESPEFKEKYDDWQKRLERKQKKSNIVIVLGGTPEETAKSQAFLKLKEVQQKYKNRKIDPLLAKRKSDIRSI